MVTSQCLLVGMMLVGIGMNCACDRYAYGMTTVPPQSRISSIQQQTSFQFPISPYSDQTTNNLLSRRSVLVLVSTISSFISDQSIASEGNTIATSDEQKIDTTNSNFKRPFAPLSALLPAARLKLLVDEIYVLSTTLKSIPPTTSSSKDQYMTLKRMNEKWINRPQLLQTNEWKQLSLLSQTGRMKIPANRSNNKQNSNIIGSDDVSNTIQYQISSVFTQAGTKRQWNILQSRERTLEQNNEIRAVFNYYTKQIQFSTSTYALTASVEVRKQLIRNNQLPTLGTVITSDLDLRDLYRNEFITYIDDAFAEINYQLNQNKNSSTNTDSSSLLIDVSDVIDLIYHAHTTLTKWFDLIPADDVKVAMETVTAEQIKYDTN